MLASDQEDSPGFDFSVLDKARIEDLSLGESMEGENGLFKIQKLKNGYCLWAILTNGRPVIFPTQIKIIEYLENASNNLR